MRYALAAVSLLIAVVFLGLGIAQRTIWAPPTSITAQVQDAVTTPVLLIDGSVLNSETGRQSISIQSSGPIALVYGRTHDVIGWVGSASYSNAVRDDEGNLELDVVEGSESTVPSIIGSDLWIENHEGTGELQITDRIPAGITVAIVSDGTAPAPSDVKITWPFSGTTPLFGPFMTAGAVFLLFALMFFLLALRAHRRRRGPQRTVSRELSKKSRSKELARATKRGLPAPASTEQPEVIDAGVAEVSTSSDAQASSTDEEIVDAEVVDDTLDSDVSVDDADFTHTADSADSTDGTNDGEASDADESDIDNDSNPPHNSDGAGVRGRLNSRAQRRRDQKKGDDVRERRATARSRKRFGFKIAIPMLLTGLVLSGCSPQYWPQPEASDAPVVTGDTPEPTSIEDTLPDPAVTARQFDRILESSRTVITDADEALDIDLASSRLTGEALATRYVNYGVRGTDGAIAALPGIPDGEVSLLLPQQQDAWPRTVFAVVGWQDDTRTPSAMMFVQSNARENYKITSMFELVPGSTIPEVASAEIGAVALPPSTPLLKFTPDSIAPAYADVLLNGDASESTSMFDLEGDALNESIGKAAKDAQVESLPTASIEFTNGIPEDAQTTTLITVDQGAIVGTYFTESTTIRPSEEGAKIQAAGQVQVLLGKSESETGITTTYGIGALYYVPSADAGENAQVQLLGYSRAILSAAEVE
ncbi:hypothetical protein [Humidisolicoccus flavus]|uniref:hypothetical protein n=1 Tax=Humidisolicoccus flavus TaxID=3111414 RepID=UPI00324FAF4F